MASMLKELKMHSLSDIVSMGFSFIATKLFYPGATLVRRPFHIRQKSNLRFEPGFTTGHGCRFEMFDEGVTNSDAIAGLATTYILPRCTK